MRLEIFTQDLHRDIGIAILRFEEVCDGRGQFREVDAPIQEIIEVLADCVHCNDGGAGPSILVTPTAEKS